MSIEKEQNTVLEREVEELKQEIQSLREQKNLLLPKMTFLSVTQFNKEKSTLAQPGQTHINIPRSHKRDDAEQSQRLTNNAKINKRSRPAEELTAHENQKPGEEKSEKFLQAQIREEKKKNESLHAQIREERNKNKKLHDESEVRYKNLEDQFIENESLNAITKYQLTLSSKKIEELNNEIVDLSNKLTNQSEENKTQQKKIEELNQEIDALRKKLTNQSLENKNRERNHESQLTESARIKSLNTGKPIRIPQFPESLNMFLKNCRSDDEKDINIAKYKNPRR